VEPEITHEVLRDWDFELLELFHEIADRAFNPPLPILQNTDRDPISPHKLVFDLKAPPRAAFDALKHLALDDTDEDATRDSQGRLTGVHISWKKRGNKIHASWDNTLLGSIEIDGARLVAEVNSAARADAVRKEIETALGEDVRYRASEVQSPEKIRADPFALVARLSFSEAMCSVVAGPTLASVSSPGLACAAVMRSAQRAVGRGGVDGDDGRRTHQPADRFEALERIVIELVHQRADDQVRGKNKYSDSGRPRPRLRQYAQTSDPFCRHFSGPVERAQEPTTPDPRFHIGFHVRCRADACAG
jgi:hypothetical protein